MLYRVELRGDRFVALHSSEEYAEPYVGTAAFEVTGFRGTPRAGLWDGRDLGLGKQVGYERVKLKAKRGHRWEGGRWVRK